MLRHAGINLGILRIQKGLFQLSHNNNLNKLRDYCRISAVENLHSYRPNNIMLVRCGVITRFPRYVLIFICHSIVLSVSHYSSNSKSNQSTITQTNFLHNSFLSLLHDNIHLHKYSTTVIPFSNPVTNTNSIFNDPIAQAIKLSNPRGRRHGDPCAAAMMRSRRGSSPR